MEVVSGAKTKTHFLVNFTATTNQMTTVYVCYKKVMHHDYGTKKSSWNNF
jgi:hypothetical protein